MVDVSTVQLPLWQVVAWSLWCAGCMSAGEVGNPGGLRGDGVLWWLMAGVCTGVAGPLHACEPVCLVLAWESGTAGPGWYLPVRKGLHTVTALRARAYQAIAAGSLIRSISGLWMWLQHQLVYPCPWGSQYTLLLQPNTFCSGAETDVFPVSWSGVVRSLCERPACSLAQRAFTNRGAWVW